MAGGASSAEAECFGEYEGTAGGGDDGIELPEGRCIDCELDLRKNGIADGVSLLYANGSLM